MYKIPLNIVHKAKKRRKIETPVQFSIIFLRLNFVLLNIAPLK